MLARPWDEKLVSFPAHVQPKLNGLRMVYDFRSDKLWSRDQHAWKENVLPGIYKNLRSETTKEVFRYVAAALEPYTLLGLDGEAYSHGMSLQQINSRASVNRVEPHKEHHLVGFHVFDLISMAPFAQRADAMQMLGMVEIPHVNLVPTHYCGTESMFNELYELYYHKEKYEGLIWRSSKAPYGFEVQCPNKENRWNYLVKRKPRLDMDVMVLGWKEGEGKHSDMLGAFHCKTMHGKMFWVGSGLDESSRRAIWELGLRRFIGRPIRIDYEVLSDDLVPLKPTIACVPLPLDV